MTSEHFFKTRSRSFGKAFAHAHGKCSLTLTLIGLKKWADFRSRSWCLEVIKFYLNLKFFYVSPGASNDIIHNIIYWPVGCFSGYKMFVKDNYLTGNTVLKYSFWPYLHVHYAEGRYFAKFSIKMKVSYIKWALKVYHSTPPRNHT
jgi:hypothetical protein